MRRRACRGGAAALAVPWRGAAGGAPAPRPPAPSATPFVERPPAVVFHAYLVALAKLRRPKAVSFDYTVSQLGLREMEQTHHVYRSGLNERDETLVVDGYTLKAPAVRILRNRTYRYDVTSVAPRPAQYAFAYGGATLANGAPTYRFHTIPRASRAFQVLDIELDGGTLLPALVRFRTAGGGARGEGTLRYARVDAHWVVREARVTAKLANRKVARERIVWSNYRFYEALPKATFDVPKPKATPPPSPLGLPLPLR
ncbi:MAG: hypothetical protein NVS3B16_18120 [Vulcanimicrobiaceae bacterium]